jgi:hypothetical protein
MRSKELLPPLRVGGVKIGEDCHGGVAAVDADDAAAWMGAGSAEVEASHRCARGEAIGVHMRGKAVTLEDVAAGKTYFFFDVGWAEDLHVNDSSVHVGAEAAEGFEG